MSDQKLSNIELLKKAYKDDTIEIEFDAGGVMASLNLADIQSIFSEQSQLQDLKYAEYAEKGFDQKPINEHAWKKFIGGIEDEKHKKRLEEDKPENLAEQFADRDTRNLILSELVPRHLKDPKTKKRLFTDAGAVEFGQLVLSTPKLARLLNNEIMKMTEQVDKIRETAKN